MSSLPMVRKVNSIILKKGNIGFMSAIFMKRRLLLSAEWARLSVRRRRQADDSSCRGELAKAAPPRFAESILPKIAFMSK
ncbi:hypothetical protein CYL18_04020 [Pradoshia eiseniae]|uniref:Uncharacterized protein n=2 Tax=Pradoshia eiseniae TaxID=2064768 RepID=A0A2S7N524_9BACI|nr:hypothetical protein CYL18_04020 [Pradoshia eiseniae]